MNVPDSSRADARLLAAGCLVLGVSAYSLYRVNFDQFFQGDALVWLQYRFHNAGEFFRAFFRLDVAHWYRPLSNRMIPSLFYPVWGLRPLGYHLVVFGCFFATSCLVFGFLRYLTRDGLVAFLAAFYFTIHSNNVYTTYDFAFAPELFYVFFYVSSVWLFLEAESRTSVLLRAASVAAFVFSLMSKEAAVTLPAMLILCHAVWLGGGAWRALKATALHWVVWGAYLACVVWYLGVGGGGYSLSIGTPVVRNLISALFYALNLRHNGWMPERAVPQTLFVFLVALGLVLVAGAAWFLLRGPRRLMILGLGGLCWAWHQC